MAYISPHPSKEKRKTWRIVYHITLGTAKKRKVKYTKRRTDAELLHSRLVELEHVTRQGFAPEEKIEEWIGQKYIAEREAAQAFRYYEDLMRQKRRIGTSRTDYQAIYDRIDDRSARGSKGGPGDKTHTSRMSYMRRIRVWLEAAAPDLHDLTEEMVLEYKEQVEQKYAQNTVRQTMQKLKLFLDEAVGMGMLGQNPAQFVAIPRSKTEQPRRILRLDEIDTFRQVAVARHAHRASGGLPAAIYLGVYAGLRQREMVWLSWQSIDWERRIMSIQRTVCPVTGRVWIPKGKSYRLIDVKQELVDFLQTERDRQQKAGALQTFVIHRKGGVDRPAYMDTLEKAFRKMVREEKRQAQEKGIEPPLADDITLHCLRHSYCTWLLRSGVDLETVRDRMGHEDIKTTEGYLHDIEPEEHPTDSLP